jgi:UDP-2,4-diacetamido-2,4,6-trideoxy-beta-L-altropyranose hydrolase
MYKRVEVRALMKIAFVTDGGLEMGMGHVQQSTTLAKELMRRAEICFLTKSDDTVVRQIEGCGFRTFRLKTDDELANLLKEIEPKVVIIDKPDVAEPFVAKLRNSMKIKLVIFSNVTDANKYADIAVAADLLTVSKLGNVKFQTTDTLYLYGPKYWILRKEFYELHDRRKVVSGKVEKILLIFGGSDPSNLTSTVLEELLSLDQDYKIDVIMGPHFENLDSISRVLANQEGKRENVRLYNNVVNVAELMYDADLVIASPGLSTFEALCVGTPVIIMPQNELQQEVYQAYLPMLRKGQVRKLGRAIARGEFVDPRDETVTRLDIGQGMPDLVNLILD